MGRLRQRTQDRTESVVSNGPRGALTKGPRLAASPMAESVDSRAREVGALLSARRKVALAFKRTGDEACRVELSAMDAVLRQHQIDIPAIAARLAVKKT